MTSEGGRKRSFSPFLIFLEATRPLSPTSTIPISIFWGGRPEFDNHFKREEAVSRESISHPQGMVSMTTEGVEGAFVVVAETEK